jgi:hypothetical protein
MASEVHIRQFIQEWLRDGFQRQGVWRTLRAFTTNFWEFLRDSTPSRRRQRYGDMDFDWDFRVDTTSGTVGWRERLLGAFLSPYQPTEPALFHEMLQSLEIEYADFTFIDLGSGKGRALLMAAEYPFRRILGVELLPGLHAVAVENLRKFHSPAQKCFALESRCEDARQFQFPAEPTVLYLFNPLPETGLKVVMRNLMVSLHGHARPIRVLYHNPLRRDIVDATGLQILKSTERYQVYGA